MKRHYIHIIILIFGVLINNISKAQIIDTSAIVRLTNFDATSTDSLSFDIYLIRKSANWNRFANTTLYIRINDTNASIDDNKYKIQYINGTTNLNLGAVYGQQLPTDVYNVYSSMIKDTAKIFFLGPEKYGDCTFVTLNDSIRLGRFVIYKTTPSTGLNDVIASELSWLEPTLFYQACAFKLTIDSILPNGVHLYQNDNKEFENWCESNIAYISDRAPEACMTLKYFDVYYIGAKIDSLAWETACEKYNKGFILRRGEMPYGKNDLSLVNFNTLIGRFDGPTQIEKKLIGLGTHTPGTTYNYPDTLSLRSEQYCYLLSYVDFFDVEHELARACIVVPHAVITYAQPNPNPFSTSTTIRYHVDDDVILTASVYNLTGEEIGKLSENGQEINKVEKKIGWHEAVFHAPDLAVNGLYEIIFIAYPIDDTSVEISRAMVKIQLIR